MSPCYPSFYQMAGNIRKYQEDFSNLEQQNFNLKLQLYHSNLSKQSSQQMSHGRDSNIKTSPNQSSSNQNVLHSSAIPIRSNSKLAATGVTKSPEQYSNVPPDYYDLKAENAESKKKIESLETSVTLLKVDLDALSGKQSSSLKNNDNNQRTPPRTNGRSQSYTSPDHHLASHSAPLLMTPNGTFGTPISAIPNTHQVSNQNLTNESNILSSMIMEKDAEMIQSLNHQLSDYTTKYSKSASVIEYCMEQINGYKVEVSNYKQVIEEQSETINAMEVTKKELTAQLETYKSAHNTQTMQTSTILKEKASLEAAIIQLNSSYDRLKAENNNLKSQCSEYLKSKAYFSTKCEFMEQRVLQLSSQQSQQRKADIENIRHEIFSRLEVTHGISSAKLRSQQKLDLDDILECIVEATIQCAKSPPISAKNNELDCDDDGNEDDGDDDSIAHVRVVKSSKKDVSSSSRRGSPAVSRAEAVSELQNRIESNMKFIVKETPTLRRYSNAHPVDSHMYTNGAAAVSNRSAVHSSRSVSEAPAVVTDSSSSGLDSAADYRRVIEFYK